MKIYVHPIMNLGDFLNAMPVLSGLRRRYGRIQLFVRNEMARFNGFKSFLMYQGLFESVFFDNENQVPADVLLMNSITREDRSDPNRPIETCRYENYMKDNYDLDFDVDDEFMIKHPDLDIDVASGHWFGDRWAQSSLFDNRRASEIFKSIQAQNKIDFRNYLLTNAYIISKMDRPFVSTFTGVSVLADLLKKPQLIVWEDSMRDWDGRPIEYSFMKHFYGNRLSRLIYIGELEREIASL
jgi:hypothetical protein